MTKNNILFVLLFISIIFTSFSYALDVGLNNPNAVKVVLGGADKTAYTNKANIFTMPQYFSEICLNGICINQWNLSSMNITVNMTETDPLSLHLDQSTPQTVDNGVVTFDDGLIAGLNGNVLIGTDSLSAYSVTDGKLFIQSDGVAALSMRSQGTPNARFEFTIGNTPDAGLQAYNDDTASYLDIYYDALAHKFRTGNVLIGTASDDGVSKLQVTGNINVTGNISGSLVIGDNIKLNIQNTCGCQQLCNNGTGLIYNATLC